MGLLGAIIKARPDYVRRVNYAIFFLLFSLSTGIIGYMLIEHFTFVEALYMTIITVSTVGFQEVHHLSDTGRLFTAFLIIQVLVHLPTPFPLLLPL